MCRCVGQRSLGGQNNPPRGGGGWGSLTVESNSFLHIQLPLQQHELELQVHFKSDFFFSIDTVSASYPGFRIDRFNQPLMENNIFIFPTADSQPEMENTVFDPWLVGTRDAKGRA